MHVAVAAADDIGGEEQLANFFERPVSSLRGLGVCRLGTEGEPHGFGQPVLRLVESG